MIRSLFLFAALAMTAPSLAQAPGSERGNTMQVYIREPGNGPVSESLLLPLSKAAVINLPVDAVDILVTNPEVVQAVIRTPRRAYLLGISVGQTNAFFFDADGQLILDLDLRVERDLGPLQESLNRFLPNARVTAEAMNDHIVLSGSVPSAVDADTALSIAQRWVDTPEQILSMITVEGRDQVMLKVRIVEMQRSIVRQLGVNLNGTTNFGEFAPPVRVQRYQNINGIDIPVVDSNGNNVFDTINEGSYASQTTVGTDNGYGVAGRALGGLVMGGTLNNLVDGVLQSSIGATLNALERVGLVRTLAEPNLTAITGESANFLAGGEFPVPTGRDRDGNVIIEYKPFGVGLGFTPVVLSEGRISMRISTEVSELSSDGSLVLNQSVSTDGAGNQIVIPGMTIPGLTVNRTETTVELPSGGSLVLAGLIREETRQNLDQVPGIGNVPILGSLFRSRDFLNQETELVILVTPYLVDPTNPAALATPADGYENANEMDAMLFGRLNRIYSVPGADTGERRWNGPVGFLFD
ncbi:type II and III secretion system protein family protein [Maricaulis salignorans]|uniref:Pilus assembly protein CpaC n=1 Tax=Maricaulis salignorans TaxID=144026 RepID=A0A1G9NE80_9PROT|nr:type II and III secretion system protein family protein [Maricaulis salignorans]SDL84772.1 pilus assembly protein CpaC [Maricaulis salignorans]